MPETPEPQTTPEPTHEKHTISFSLPMLSKKQYQLIIAILAAVVILMLFWWKPWHSSATSDRSISVTGTATIKSAPDEYIFTPSYQSTISDQKAALAALSAQSDTIITKLKSLGVTNGQIKSSVYSSVGGPIAYNNNVLLPTPVKTNTNGYTLQFTITVSSQAIAQKVQDYLTTTSPSGSVSPQYQFSASKTNSLQSEARDEAAVDARSKAEQEAKNLGFRLGAVKSVQDGNGFGIAPQPLNAGSDLVAPAVGTASPSLSVQPGENDYSYSVTVEYYIH